MARFHTPRRILKAECLPRLCRKRGNAHPLFAVGLFGFSVFFVFVFFYKSDKLVQNKIKRYNGRKNRPEYHVPRRGVAVCHDDFNDEARNYYKRENAEQDLANPIFFIFILL